MRADAGVALGAVGLALAAYFLANSGSSMSFGSGSGSSSGGSSSSTPTIFYENVGVGGVSDAGSVSTNMQNMQSMNGSGVTGVINPSAGAGAGGTAAGIFTGAGRVPQNYAAEFMPTPKQADMSANSYAAEYKPTISAIQDTTLKGTGSGAVGAISGNKKPKDEALYSVVRAVTDMTADVLETVSFVPVSSFSPVGTPEGRNNAADNVYNFITNPVEYHISPIRWLASSVGGLFK